MTHTCVKCGGPLIAGLDHECSTSGQLTIVEDDPTANNGGSTNYYQLPAGAVEMQDLIEHRNMNFAQGNMFKALYRANASTNNHSSYERDLNKIIWYAQRELARLKGQ